MSKAENPNSQTPVTIFEVDSYGTLEMSNFEGNYSPPPTNKSLTGFFAS